MEKLILICFDHNTLLNCNEFYIRLHSFKFFKMYTATVSMFVDGGIIAFDSIKLNE